jgi:hypothetical protein
VTLSPASGPKARGCEYLGIKNDDRASVTVVVSNRVCCDLCFDCVDMEQIIMNHPKSDVEVHHLPMHYNKKFSCGVYVDSLVDKESDWNQFNKLRSTTPKEITCPGCLEFLLQKKKAEIKEIEDKLWMQN